MAKIIFDVYPSISHLNMTFALAELYSNHGHDLTFICEPEFENHVLKHQFAFIGVQNYLFRKDPAFNVKNKFHFFLKNYQLFKSGLKERIILERAKTYEETLIDLKPDLVFVDHHLIINSIITHALRINTAIIHSKFSSRKRKNVPPFNAHFLQPNFPANYFITEVIWQKLLLKEAFKRYFFQLISFKQDYFSMAKLLAKTYHFPFDRYLDTKRCFDYSFNHLKEILLSPDALEVAPVHHANEINIGPMHFEKRDIHLPSFHPTLLDELKELKGVKPIIFASMGSITSSEPKLCHRFYQHMIAVARNLPDYFFILTISKEFDLAHFQHSAPQNVRLYQFVPQLEVLKYASLMINHGGLQSICECIYYKVPMICYPLTKHWDQPGNSARVTYHKIGLRGQIQKDNPIKMINKINNVLENYSTYKKTITEIRDKVYNGNENATALKVLADLLKENHLTVIHNKIKAASD